MTAVNYDDVIAQLQDAGLEVVGGIEVDTHRPVRVREINGDRERRGWYWLQSKIIDGETYVVGAYGVYRGLDAGKTAIKLRRDGKAVRLSEEERAAIHARQAANAARLKAMRKAEAERAAQAAAHVWRAYAPEGDSEYLRRKRVRAHGVRFAPGAGTVAVPMMDAGGKIWGLQIIRGKDRAAGKLEKEYWPRGLLKTGHYHLIGGTPRALVLVAEGYATAATLHEATGHAVAVAFDAGNLLPVAESLSRDYRVRVLVCADDDAVQKCRACKRPTWVADAACDHCGEPHGQANPGVSAARNAAHAVDGAAVVPIFCAARPRDRKGPNDFNDLAALEGEAVVRAQIETVLRSLGWLADAPPAAGALSGGAGHGVDERPAAQSIMGLDSIVERFVLLDDGTGDHLFDTWTRRVVKQKQMVALLAPGVRVDDVKRHPSWTRRACYLDQVGFDPACKDERVVLNTWRGWPRRPKEGRCDVLLDLLMYLCNGEGNGPQVYEWLIRWMAYPLQHPGAKMSSAVIMHGPQGTGKSSVFKALARIYGDGDPYRNYSLILDQKALQDKFNADWDSKLFVLAEEVVNSSDKWQLKNELKEIVSGDRLRINDKFVKAYYQTNRCNIVFLSNEHQPLPLENDDRRHLVVWTPPELDASIYDDVYAEMDAGGIDAFYHHLLSIDLTGFHPKKRPPMTAAKAELIGVSLGSEERFVREWIAGDVALRDDEPLPFCPCGSTDLYSAYQRWCRQQGVARPREMNQFMSSVLKRTGWMKEHKNRLESWSGTVTKRQRFVLPSDADMQEAVRQGGQDWRQKPGESMTSWLSGCFFAFRNALGDAQ